MSKVSTTMDSQSGVVRCSFGALTATYMFAHLVTLAEMKAQPTVYETRDLLLVRAREKFIAQLRSAAETIE